MCGWVIRAIARVTLKPFALQPGRVSRGGQDLDRDRPVEFRVSGVIDLAHTSSAEQCQDFEPANSVSRSQGHERESSVDRAYSS
jgi:hypothetical protein